MGSNYYIQRKQPTIYEKVHICKRSWGREMAWQATEESDWPRWCDFISEGELPHFINSVEDIRAYLETGEWVLVDEYGTVYGDEPREKNGETINDWRTKLQELEDWDGGKSAWNAHHPDEPVTWEPQRNMGGFRDRKGNHFTREGFC